MSVLVYTEAEEGKFKKTAYEVASYARGIADMMGTDVTAITVNADDASSLGDYGVDKVLHIKDDKLKQFTASAYASILKQAATNEGSKVVVLSSSANAKYLAPLLAVQLDAGYASNVVALPESENPFKVKRTAFTNKAFSHTEITTDIKIISLGKNAYGLKESNKEVKIEDFTPEMGDNAFNVSVESIDKAKDKVSIADAEVVVSGGRGLKGPENWGMIEEMADILGAAT
ncbi:MAG: FAD-binding protein, partial [Leeuwenhoekiella sp.]